MERKEPYKQLRARLALAGAIEQGFKSLPRPPRVKGFRTIGFTWSSQDVYCFDESSMQVRFGEPQRLERNKVRWRNLSPRQVVDSGKRVNEASNVPWIANERRKAGRHEPLPLGSEGRRRIGPPTQFSPEKVSHLRRRDRRQIVTCLHDLLQIRTTSIADSSWIRARL